MPTFKDAILTILDHEGGFVNNPADRGGATNLGITIGTLSTWLGRQATIADVQNLTKDTAIAIYKKNYWDKVSGDQLKYYSVALTLFDQAVNRGPASAIKQAQKIVGVTQDGVMGPKTVEAINKMPDSQFLPQYLSASAAFYNKLVQNDSSQGVFLQGWLNRISSLQTQAYAYLGTTQGKVVASVGLIAVLGVAGFVLFKVMNPATTPRLA